MVIDLQKRTINYKEIENVKNIKIFLIDEIPSKNQVLIHTVENTVLIYDNLFYRKLFSIDDPKNRIYIIKYC